MDFQNELQSSIRSKQEVEDENEKRLIQYGEYDAKSVIDKLKEKIIELAKNADYVTDDDNKRIVYCKQAIDYDNIDRFALEKYSYLKKDTIQTKKEKTHGFFNTYKTTEWSKQCTFSLRDDIRAQTYFNTIEKLAAEEGISVKVILCNKNGKEYSLPVTLYANTSGGGGLPSGGYYTLETDYGLYIKATYIIPEKTENDKKEVNDNSNNDNSNDEIIVKNVKMWDTESKRPLEFALEARFSRKEIKTKAMGFDIDGYNVSIEPGQYVFASVDHIENTDLSVLNLGGLLLIMQPEDATRVYQFYEEYNNELRANEEIGEKRIDELYSKISGIDNLASNVINLIENDIFLHRDAVLMMQRLWGYCKYADLDTDEDDNLYLAIAEVQQYIKNMAQIIMEENNISDDDAEKVSWKAIKQNCVKMYSRQWQKEYEIYLPETIEQTEGDIKKYIHNIIFCNEIEHDNLKTIALLTYHVIDICYINKPAFFSEIYDSILSIFNDAEKEIDEENIRNKIKGVVKKKTFFYTINDIDLMTGAEFEEFICHMFRKMGYRSEVTKQTGDQGLDVIAERNGIKIGIQAKCYSNTVGNSAIQEAVAGKNYYGCKKVIVVTNNRFTMSAIDLAKSNDVILWDRDILKEKIKEM